MPELPEVHTVIECIKQEDLGKTIVSTEVFRAKNIEGNLDDLIGSTITGFEQYGKYIVFRFNTEKILISHLRMEGKYFFRNKDDKPQKHDIASLIFSDGTSLVYNDVRKFGVLQIRNTENYKKIPPLSDVGPDPFHLDDPNYLKKAFKDKNTAIKTALLDQSIMSGLGNIYVDEVLYECKIHPETPAKLVGIDSLKQILEASKTILSKAIEQGGSTIKSYHPKEGVSGNFQVSLKVYGHKDGNCFRCGHHLRKIKVNGRGTTYCPYCQKNPALPKVIAITGPIGSGKSTVLDIFKKMGYEIIDADVITHELYKQKEVQTGLKKIIPELKIKNGEVDRDFLRGYLLANPNKKKRLEKYVHSLVSDNIISIIKHSKKNITMEVPLLFESHLDDFADEIIYVDAPLELRKQRLTKRDKFYNETLLINKDYDLENKKKATYVIVNDKSPKLMEKEIKTIFDK